jgi:undecaprenyl-diphosphatase
MMPLTPRERGWLGAAAAGALLFLIALVGWRSGALAPWDAAAAGALGRSSGPAHDAAGVLATVGGTAVVAIVIVLAAAWLAWRRRWWGAARVVVLPAAGEAFVILVKELARRPRPPNPLETDFSFPSGHATDAAIFACLLAWYALGRGRRAPVVVFLLLVASTWAVVVAASRLVLGVHYLTDVLAGLGGGVAVAGAGLAALGYAERSRWAP